MPKCGALTNSGTPCQNTVAHEDERCHIKSHQKQKTEEPNPSQPKMIRKNRDVVANNEPNVVGPGEKEWTTSNTVSTSDQMESNTSSSLYIDDIKKNVKELNWIYSLLYLGAIVSVALILFWLIGLI